MDVLHEIVADTRRRVQTREASAPDLSVATARRPGAFHDALAAPGISVIAEHKRSSPSAGTIRADLSLGDVIASYERGGARALSILTEESRFGGSLADVEAARQVTELPIIRKDFIVTEFQLAEAAVAGADAVLLIVAAFPGAVPELRALNRKAHELGLDVVMEVHDAAELEVAIELESAIIGINNRNLGTLEVDLATTFELLPAIPAGTLKVAESGFRTAAEVQALQTAGVDAVLIGEALMRSADLEAACRELTGVAAAHR